MKIETIRILVSIILVIGVLIFINRQTFSPSPTESPIAKIKVECNKTPTPQLTEGPFYKEGSLQRSNIVDEATIGEKITITGYVYDTNCNSVSGAWLDFWQADGNGVYDNAGYRLRGHQFTDKDGKYVLETVVPGEYPGRTPHIHVKVRVNQMSSVVTTQLFMPNKAQNKSDSIFNEALVVDIEDTGDGRKATYNFILDLN